MPLGTLWLLAVCGGMQCKLGQRLPRFLLRKLVHLGAIPFMDLHS